MWVSPKPISSGPPDVSGESTEYFGSEEVGDAAHVAVIVDAAIVAGGDSGGFLAPVLERVEA